MEVCNSPPKTLQRVPRKSHCECPKTAIQLLVSRNSAQIKHWIEFVCDKTAFFGVEVRNIAKKSSLAKKTRVKLICWPFHPPLLTRVMIGSCYTIGTWTSWTRPCTEYIRRGRERVRDKSGERPGPSENQAMCLEAWWTWNEHGWRSTSEGIKGIHHFQSNFLSYKAQRTQLSRCWL